MKRRSFLKILAGATALAACPAAIVNLCNTEPVTQLPKDAAPLNYKGMCFAVDPLPRRYDIFGGKYREVFPFKRTGEMILPNRDYRNAPVEIEVWFSPSEKKYYPLLVERKKEAA